MPCTPNACSADFTSSSLKGLITAVMSFMRPASRDALVSLPEPLRCAPASPGDVSRADTDCFRPVNGQPPCYADVSPAGLPLANDRVDECRRLERGEIVGSFAQADQLDRHSQFPLDRDDDPALGRAVQLGQHDPGDVHGLSE